MWSWNCIVYSSELWWRELAFRQQVFEFWYESLLKPNRRSYSTFLEEDWQPKVANCPPFSFFQSTRGCGWQMKTKPHFGRELKMERLCYKRHFLWDARFWNWRGQPCPCLLVKLCSMWISGFLGRHTSYVKGSHYHCMNTKKDTYSILFYLILLSHFHILTDESACLRWPEVPASCSVVLKGQENLPCCVRLQAGWRAVVLLLNGPHICDLEFDSLESRCKRVRELRLHQKTQQR